MTSFVFRRQLTIEWGHCDPAGIVFNPRFFEFFDTGTWLLFEAALGVKREDLASTFNIMGIPLVDARAEFRKPAKFGDTIEIASRVSEFRRSSFDVEHRISVNGEPGHRGRRDAGVGGARQGQPRKDRRRRHSRRRHRQIRITIGSTSPSS